MDLAQMLSELRSWKEQIDEAVLVLQRLAAGSAKRRGKATKVDVITVEASSPVTPLKRNREPFRAATRKKMAEAQRLGRAKVKRQQAA